MSNPHARSIIIVDAYLKGVTDFNQTGLYSFMRTSATQPTPFASRDDVQDYIALGFVPVENATNGVCLTQAYACTTILTSSHSVFC